MLLLASSICGLFKWRQFEPEVILLAVGWYLRFSLSYRDVEELLAERGLRADHVTVWTRVQRYGPEMEQRLRRRLKTNQRQLAGGRDVRAGERQMGVFIPGCGLHRCDDRLLTFGQTRCSRRRALSGQSLRRCEPSAPSGHQHRQVCRLPAGDCATQRRGCSGGELPTPTGAVPQ